MHQEPYYFDVIPRTIISKSFEKQGQFKFYIYRQGQMKDSSQMFPADFKQKRMKVNKAKLNFYLQNYKIYKHKSAKYILKLSKKQKNYGQQLVGQYQIDTSTYIEEFKKTGINFYAEVWELADNYAVQIQIIFAQSRYYLERLEKKYQGNPSSSFKKPLEPTDIKQSRKSEAEDKQYDNEDRYKQKRLQILNAYSTAFIGQGGYGNRLVDEQQQENNKKKAQAKQSQQTPILKHTESKLLISAIKQPLKKDQIKKQNSQNKVKENPLPKVQQQKDPSSQLKNLKYIILAIILLIVLGSGYFISKVYLRGAQENNQLSGLKDLQSGDKDENPTKKTKRESKKPAKGKVKKSKTPLSKQL